MKFSTFTYLQLLTIVLICIKIAITPALNWYLVFIPFWLPIFILIASFIYAIAKAFLKYKYMNYE